MHAFPVTGRNFMLIALALGLMGGTRRVVAQRPDSAKMFQDSVAAREQAIAEGRKIFHGEGTCFACHGPKLEGTALAPTLRAHKWRNGDGSLTMILRVLHAGVPNTLMVSHPGNINETELQKVASYVWAVSRGAVPP
jgi:mono/diheme cytochrome c family protein